MQQPLASRTNFRLDQAVLAEALRGAVPTSTTPHRTFLRASAQANFSQLATILREYKGLRAAYSVKTNPRDAMIDLALAHGMDVEVISEAEWQHVRARGFEPARILYNGPRPLGDTAVAISFADSIEAFKRNAMRPMGVAHGIRVRPLGIASRFGVRPSSLAEIADAARRSSCISSLAVSFFVRSQDLHDRSWASVAREIVEDASLFEQLARKPVTAFDVGGGCSPAEFDERWTDELPDVVRFAFGRLRSLERMYVEPGQEIATPVEAVIARVLEVRDGVPREVVIDAGLPSMPRVDVSDHRVFRLAAKDWLPLESGNDRILGCICMEEDIVKQGVCLTGVREGDVLAIADTGAYDSSMAFSFAKGRSVPEAA